jgi:DNA-binding XRE family transcriptional regulator
MEISIDQIKAARALLDWTQDDLATFSSLSKASIQNYENKKTKPNSTSLYKIIDAFSDNNVEFIEEGVQKKTLKTKTYRGQKGLVDFMDLVYETAKTQGGEFCVSNVDETVFTQRFGEAEDAIYTRKMSVLDSKFTFKTLIKEGDTNFVGSEYCEYRWVSEKQFHSIPFYVFGDYMAFLIFGQQTIVHLIESKEIADAQRAQFYLIWESAEIPHA